MIYVYVDCGKIACVFSATKTIKCNKTKNKNCTDIENCKERKYVNFKLLLGSVSEKNCVYNCDTEIKNKLDYFSFVCKYNDANNKDGLNIIKEYFENKN